MIETGTEICSVALSYGDSVSDEIVIREPRSHTRVLGSIIDELLKRNRITIDDCDAVAVSEGPGSYTGLRVGVSAAKGLCYGSGKPLIAVNSLLVIARLAIEQSLLPSEDSLIYAILDAKRDEVSQLL
jgi:tRNA threonylcarbamoyladenosine biosynthesis protein TsaB